jgi:uncharacterized protein YndB with AHSA1/START domain
VPNVRNILWKEMKEMRRIEVSVVINRPIEEVFAYVTNPENEPLWQSGVLESELVGEGPLGVGAKTREVRKLLGRRLESTAEVTAYEPNAKIAFKSTSGPVQYEAWYTFEPVDAGTKLTIVGEGDTGSLFKLAEGLVMRQFEKEMQTALAALKDILESQA